MAWASAVGGFLEELLQLLVLAALQAHLEHLALARRANRLDDELPGARLHRVAHQGQVALHPHAVDIGARREVGADGQVRDAGLGRSEEHTSELQSRQYLVCRLLLEKKKKRR